MRKHSYGFTIVELLIVIVVIGVLASISVVAYSGVQTRANFARMQNDMSSLKKALDLYYVDHGGYPDSSECHNVDGYTTYIQYWCGWSQGKNESFIPGLAPEYISETPTVHDPLKLPPPRGDTYLYRSKDPDNAYGGTTMYQLIRFNPDGLDSIEIENNPLRMEGNGYDGLGWGYQSQKGEWW